MPVPQSITEDVSSAPELPAHLVEFLAALRLDPRFHQVLQACRQTRCPTYRLRSASSPEAQERAWIYASGKLEAEQRILAWLSGKDDHDRQFDTG